MPSLDAEWEEAAKIIAETAAGCPIQWQCLISEHNARAIEQTANQRIEGAFVVSKMQTVTLPEPFGNWTIDLENKVQTNDKKGTKRSVRRTVVVAT